METTDGTPSLDWGAAKKTLSWKVKKLSKNNMKSNCDIVNNLFLLHHQWEEGENTAQTYKNTATHALRKRKPNSDCRWKWLSLILIPAVKPMPRGN